MAATTMLKWLAVALLAAVAIQAYPGVNVAIYGQGLQYITTQAVKQVNAQLSGEVIKLPDVSGEKDGVDYSITGLELKQLSVEGAKAAIAPGIGLNFGTTDVHAQVSANWSGRRKHWPHLHGSGSLSVTMSSVNAVAKIQLYTSDGHLNSKALSSSVSIGDLSIDFHGSHLDWLFNILKGVLKGKIKSGMEKAMANALEKAVTNTLENELKKLPTYYDIPKTPLGVDYAAVGALNITSEYISGGASGYAFVTTHHAPPPLPQQHLPPVVALSPQPMVELMVSEYTLSSLGYAAHASGEYVGHFNASQVPEGSPLTLNTTSWKSVVPELTAKYPNMLMVANVSLGEVPVVTVSKADMNVTVVIQLALAVVTPTGNQPAFTVDIDMALLIEPTVTKSNLTGVLKGLRTNTWLVSSGIGSFDINPLRQLISFAAATGGAEVQNILKTGFPLPIIDGYEFEHPVVTTEPGYILVATSIAVA